MPLCLFTSSPDDCAEWASGLNDAVVEWETVSRNDIRYHTFHRRDQQPFKEANEIALWGNWYWATREDEVRPRARLSRRPLTADAAFFLCRRPSATTSARTARCAPAS